MKRTPKTKTFKCRCGKRCCWSLAGYLDCVADGVEPMCAKCDDRRVIDQNASNSDR